MKIAFVAQHFGRKEEMSFGPNPLIYNIIKGVAEKEEVLVLAGGFPKKTAVEKVEGIKVLRVFSSHPAFLGKNPFLNFGILGLGKILKEKPAVINSQDFDAAFLFKLLNAFGSKAVKVASVKSILEARLEKTPKGLESTYSASDRGLLFFQKRFERMCVQNSDLLVVQSNHAKKELERIFKPKATTRLIYNGVDSRIFKPLKLEDKNPALLFAGGTDLYRKGADVFFHSFVNLKKEIPELKAIVIGASSPGNFEKLLKERGISKTDLEFFNRVPYTKMPLLLNRASVILVPSFHETFGSIAAEAMACGKAVVASDSTALPEVVGNAGVLAKTGSVKDFAEKTKRLLENKALRKKIGKKARERVLENFTAEKTVNGYLKLFRSLK